MSERDLEGGPAGEWLHAAWVETPEPSLNEAFGYVRDYWPELTRPGSWLAFPLPNPYVRPGGFVKMFVYWDLYFTLLGLVVQGRWSWPPALSTT
jgi:neutral trehalase